MDKVDTIKDFMKKRRLWIQADIIRSRSVTTGLFTDIIPVYKFRLLRYSYYRDGNLYFRDPKTNGTVSIADVEFGKRVKKHSMYPAVHYANV